MQLNLCVIMMVILVLVLVLVDLIIFMRSHVLVRL